MRQAEATAPVTEVSGGRRPPEGHHLHPAGTGEAGARHGPHSRKLPSPVLLAAIGIAWMLAVTAEVTNRTDVVHHHGLHGDGQVIWWSLGLFVVAWQAHVVAMMLPSSLPLIQLFGRVASAQERSRAARGAFLAGYAIVWTAFGLLAFFGDAVLHEVARRWEWLHDRPGLLVGGTLMLAGAFQFSDLKDRCLHQCRHPLVFLQRYYRRGTRQAVALGLHHGLFCVGCCWALMLVMFAVGIANLTWMAPFALVMLYEKVGTHGRRIVGPLGVALLVLGALVMLGPSWLPQLAPTPGVDH